MSGSSDQVVTALISASPRIHHCQHASRARVAIRSTGYTLAAPLVGLPDAGVTLQVLLKTKQPALELYHPTRTDRDRQDFIQIISGVLCAIKIGAFYPIRDWPCQSCPYAGPCMAGCSSNDKKEYP